MLNQLLLKCRMILISTMEYRKSLLLLSLFFLFSCNKNKEISLPKIYKEHLLPINEVKIHNTIFKQVENRNATYFTHREKTDNLYVYDFDSSKVTQAYSLNENIGKIEDYAVLNDTFYALLLSPAGVLLQPLNSPEGYRFYSLKRSGLGTGNYLSFEPDGLHINIMSDGIIGSAAALKTFFRNEIDALVFLEADSLRLEKTMMNYPLNYADKYNIGLTYTNKCITPKHTYYSFAQSPELYFTDQTTIKSKDLRSNYFIEMPEIDSNNVFNFEYIESLNGSNFCAMSYNPIRDEIYRNNSHSNDGVVNKRPFSLNWSTIVANSALEVRYEVFIEGGKYVPTRTIPTRKGFALVVAPDDLDTKSKLILHEYELE